MEDQTVLQNVLAELDKEILNSDLIQDNKIYFSIDDNNYRVRMPTQQERTEATEHKNKTFVRLITDTNTLVRKKLIQLLKENQDIDVAVLQKQADELEHDLLQLHISLAKKKDSEVTAIETLKIEIDAKKQQRLRIVFEKAEYLSSCIETQVQDDYLTYLTATCTERCDKTDTQENWKKVWKSFHDYQIDGSKLAYKALAYATELVLNAYV